MDVLHSSLATKISFPFPIQEIIQQFWAVYFNNLVRKSDSCSRGSQTVGQTYNPFSQSSLAPQNLFYFRIEETTSSGNLTVVQGETVMLVCTVLDLGDKSVSKYLECGQFYHQQKNGRCVIDKKINFNCKCITGKNPTFPTL